MNREWILQIATLLSYAAGPVALVCVIDDWFRRPQRRLAALPGVAGDPGWLRVLYAILPVLIIGTVLRIVLSERMDFSLVLVSVIVVAAVVWLVDKYLLAPSRVRTAAARSVDVAAVPLPVTVDYAHSFLPVFAIVLVVRSFVFEPFRIPSDSMMPTLQDGDLIAVNKYAYGLRLPVLNNKMVSVGEPQRGDVVVFRYPPDPAINYIKRLVGLPGDRVAVKDDRLIINGQPVNYAADARYNDGCYTNMHIATEQLGTHQHQTLSCRTPGSLAATPLPGCNRWQDHSYQCGEADMPGVPDSGDYPEVVVPAGSYLMMGDNRDNSADGRYWGFVPEANLVGRAARIWFNWDLQRSGGPVWSRIGSKIE
jgi:signal peptidase I